MPARSITLLALCLLAVLPDARAQSNPGGFSTAWLDRSAERCGDFYQFACGNWMAKNPLPAEFARYGRFEELNERNQAILRGILEKASRNDAGRSRIEQQIGDFYSSCMDEAAIERLGLKPLQPELDRISALASPAGLAPLAAHLHNSGIRALLSFEAGPDYKNSTEVIAHTGQGGLSLPDRDYYLKDDPKSAELRQQYVAHVARIFELAGSAPQDAARKAGQVMEIETALARASLDRVALRNPANRYHMMTRADLAALAPSFAWDRYFEGRAAKPFERLNVGQPEFVRGLEKLISTASLDAWKAYLAWHLLRSSAPLLPKVFVEENFAFLGRTLTGAKQLRPRWKRCVAFTDEELGEALGRKYVEQAFPPESKARMLGMVAALEKSLEKNIGTLDWMTDATKKEALVKLHRVANKIGYPEEWIDYSAVKIVRGDPLGNVKRASTFNVRRDLDKVGTRTDPKEWRMTPPTVNAYYSPLENNINFPAGILQPPFFDKDMDDAVNFGGIGAVIGHELTHGFDDSGRKFDAQGNLRDWWTAADAREFDKRAECFVEQYGAYKAVEGVYLNGKLTLGENVADGGGLRIAYMALMDTLSGKAIEKVDGFTPAQRLFLGWAQVWCQTVTEEAARLRAATDPHSPGRYRVNGVVSNMPEFQQAFGCSTGQPMVREKACRVW